MLGCCIFNLECVIVHNNRPGCSVSAVCQSVLPVRAKYGHFFQVTVEPGIHKFKNPAWLS